MPSETNDQLLIWAKERIGEMDALLASLQDKADEAHTGARSAADQVVHSMRNRRDAFIEMMETHTGEGKLPANLDKGQLETAWSAFDDKAEKYFHAAGRQGAQLQAAFQSVAEAQLKAWRHLAETYRPAASDFAPARRTEADAAVTRIKAEAAAAEEKLKNLARTGSTAWPALNAGLVETRAAFDRARWRGTCSSSCRGFRRIASTVKLPEQLSSAPYKPVPPSVHDTLPQPTT